MFGATNRTPLTRRTPMKRGTIPLKRSPFTVKPKRRDYGGPVAPEHGGTYPKFRKLIFERDGVCVMCGTTENLTLAHLDKVGMGGRRTSTVNVPWNAVTLCWTDHMAQEESRVLTEALTRLLVRRHGYKTGENT